MAFYDNGAKEGMLCGPFEMTYNPNQGIIHIGK